MPSPTFLFCVSLIASAAGHVHRSLKHKVTRAKAGHFVESMQFKYKLRICNAYPSEDDLDIFKAGDKHNNKLTTEPLQYKMCGDFDSPLIAGDKLKFNIGDSSAGTFTISDMPNNDATLLLIIHRHDSVSTAVSFQSHVFANLENAQVAVLDTYKGSALGSAEIKDGKTEEQLRYNSVVALSPGEYKVGLNKKIVENLVALGKESYVIMRVGAEAERGQQYPQELVVYPMSNSALLHSASLRTSIPQMATLVLALLGTAILHQ